MGEFYHEGNTGGGSRLPKTYKKDCLFCGYVEKEPSHLINKNKEVFSVVYGMHDKGLVFSKAQTLVISREHRENFSELTKEEWEDHLPLIKDAIEKISKVYHPVGFDVFSSLNKEGGQSHFHSHIHIIPKYKKNHGYSRSKWDLSLTSQDYQEIEEKLQTKQGIIKENNKAMAKLAPFGKQAGKCHIIIKPKKSIPNDIKQLDKETWAEMWELMKESVKRCKEKLGAKGFWLHTPLGKMTDVYQTTRSEFQIDIMPRWNMPTEEIKEVRREAKRHGSKSTPENERIAGKLNQNKEVTSLYSLLKEQSTKKDRKLKVICDWDECIQSINPLIWYQLIKENKWEKGLGSFNDYHKFFWNNASVEYFPWQKTTNTCNEEIEKKRKDPKIFEEEIRKPFFKILNDPKFYDENKNPLLSIAEQLLFALKEGNLISELVFVTFSNDINGSRKRKKFQKTFGRFPNTKISIKEPGHFAKEGKYGYWEWIKENHPDFDIFIDDNFSTISQAQENLPPEKIFVMPNYKTNRHVQGENIFRVEVNCTDLKDQDFIIAAAALELKTKQLTAKSKRERESNLLNDREWSNNFSFRSIVSIRYPKEEKKK